MPPFEGLDQNFFLSFTNIIGIPVDTDTGHTCKPCINLIHLLSRNLLCVLPTKLDDRLCSRAQRRIVHECADPWNPAKVSRVVRNGKVHLVWLFGLVLRDGIEGGAAMSKRGGVEERLTGTCVLGTHVRGPGKHTVVYVQLAVLFSVDSFAAETVDEQRFDVVPPLCDHGGK